VVGKGLWETLSRSRRRWPQSGPSLGSAALGPTIRWPATPNEPTAL